MPNSAPIKQSCTELLVIFVMPKLNLWNLNMSFKSKMYICFQNVNSADYNLLDFYERTVLLRFLQRRTIFQIDATFKLSQLYCPFGKAMLQVLECRQWQEKCYILNRLTYSWWTINIKSEKGYSRINHIAACLKLGNASREHQFRKRLCRAFDLIPDLW